MKKFVIGVVVGVLLATAGTAFGATALIGKKVDSEVQIVLDGKSISNGVVIEGTSYAPVRSLTEAVGLGISYNKGVVTLESELDGTVPKIEEPAVDTSDPYWRLDTVDKLNDRIKVLEEAISSDEKDILGQQSIIDLRGTYLKKDNLSELDRKSMEDEIISRKSGIENINKNIINSKHEIEALKIKLAQLESTK